MAKSESPSGENLESQQISSSEPLGNNSPLLPQFLVPLGTQSISILQPKIFSPKLIDDFSNTTFEDSPFFDEFHPQISAKTETQPVQSNSEIIQKQPELSTSIKSVNPTEKILSHNSDEGNLNDNSPFDITTQANSIDIVNREHNEFKTPLKIQYDEIYSDLTEIKSDFSVDSIHKNTDLQNPSQPKDINIQKKSQSSTSPEIGNQVEEGFKNNTFQPESESITPQISKSNNLNQLQPSLSTEVVEDKNLVKQQSTDIINKSQSSTSVEIRNQVGEEFQNISFSQESELTTPQISTSDNLNQLQTSLSSEVVDDDSLIEKQPTDIINKSQSSTSTEINHLVEEEFQNTTFSQESELTTPQISPSDNSNQLQPSIDNVENSIQRSSLAEESHTTIPTTEDNQNLTSLYSTEDNYSSTGVDTNSPLVENPIQRSSVTGESQTTIPTTEDKQNQNSK